MLIVGARGFAKEVLEVVYQNDNINNLVFYDDVNADVPKYLYDEFQILRTEKEARHYFDNVDKRFTIGIGNPKLRQILYKKFINFGGEPISVVSKKSSIGNFGSKIGLGCNIQQGVIITNDIKIGIGVILNLNTTVGHDTTIDDFVEVCPNVNISGKCTVEKAVFIGTNAIILPEIKIGENSIIGSGAVVTKDVPKNVLVAGIPAKIIKQL